MKSDYDTEDESLRQELETLRSEKLRIDNTFSVQNKWITEFRKFETEQYLSPQMLTALIERIYVSDNAKIKIQFRYRDEFQALKNYIESIEQGAKATNE